MAPYAGGNPGLGLTRQSSAGRVMERSRAPRGRLGWGLPRTGGQAGWQPSYSESSQHSGASGAGPAYAGDASGTSLPLGRILKIRGKVGSGPSTPPLLGCLGGPRERDKERTGLQDTGITCLCISAVKNCLSLLKKKLIPEAAISRQLFKSMTATCISLRVEGTEICFAANN